MKVCFIYAEKLDGDDKGREFALAENFLAGVAASGDEVQLVRKGGLDTSTLDADAVCMVGVKSLNIFHRMRAEGKQIIYFDKGYLRHRGKHGTWEYWRVAVNDHHPTAYVAEAKHTPRRWNQIAKRRLIVLRPWRAEDNVGPVIYAGSSDKYHDFVGLPDPTAYAAEIVREIKKRTNRPVIYRPKPSWLEATPVSGAGFSSRNQTIEAMLPNSWCLVTNGSNSSFDAVLAGVPCIVLGKAVARSIFSNDLNELENPRIPTDDERDQWLANLAWCMFNETEMSEGLAWEAIRPQLFGEYFDDSTTKRVACEVRRPTKAQMKRMDPFRENVIFRPSRKRLARNKPEKTKEERRRTKPFLKGRPPERLEDE